MEAQRKTTSKVFLNTSSGGTRLLEVETPLVKKLKGNVKSDIISSTSGLLVVGKVYTIVAVLGADDFSNVGFVEVGTPFEATGTTPTTWSNNTIVYNVTDSTLESLFFENTLSYESFEIDWYYLGANNVRLVLKTDDKFIENRTYISNEFPRFASVDDVVFLDTEGDIVPFDIEVKRLLATESGGSELAEVEIRFNDTIANLTEEEAESFANIQIEFEGKYYRVDGKKYRSKNGTFTNSVRQIYS